MSQTLARLEADNAVLLVVDVQDKLLPAMEGAAGLTQSVRRMIEAAAVLGVPVLATEQYPAGLGRTCAEISQAMAGAPVVEKVLFSACVDELVSRLTELARRQVIVTGIEAHVCVQQSVLDLLRMGYAVYVCADAVSSRRALDRDVAIARMRQAGAIVTTTESVIFEMVGQAGTAQFKQVLKIVK